METMTKKNGKRAQANDNEPGALGKIVDAVGDLAKATKSPLVLHDPLRDPKLAFTGVKVFSATKQLDRNALGEMVTDWIRANPNVEIVDKVVTQSSDSEFHCLSITLFFK